jgi:hypothetical protein
MGCSASYFPCFPHLLHAFHGHNTIYSLRLTVFPRCNDLIALLSSLLALEELVLDFIFIKDEDLWQGLHDNNARLNEMIKLPRLGFLSLTGLSDTRLLEDCQWWTLRVLTCLVLRVPDAGPNPLSRFLATHGSLVTTLELYFRWDPQSYELDIVTMCPRLITLTMDWSFGSPSVIPHPHVRSVFLKTEGLTLFSSRPLPPISLLHSFRSRRLEWSAMERLTDCSTCWAPSEPMYGRWLREGVQVMQETGIVCVDVTGRLWSSILVTENSA